MTLKQMTKHADNIVKWELIHRDPNSSDEEKQRAESNILQLSNMLMCLPHGIEIMGDIDVLVQKKLQNKEKRLSWQP